MWTNFTPQLGYFLGFFAWLYVGWRKGFVWHPTALDAPFLALGTITLITAFTGVDVMNSLGGLPKTLGWMGIFVWVNHVIEDRQTIKRVILWLMASGVTQSFYGLWTYWKGDPRYLEEGGWEGWMRIYGTMSHPIFLGEGLAMVMGLGAVWVLWGDSRGRNSASGASSAASSTSGKWLMAFGVIPLAACLGLTYARGAWLGAVAAAFTLTRWASKWYWAALAVMIIAGGYAAKTHPDHQLVKRLKSIGSTENETVRERLVMWKAGVKMLRDHPLGVGVHNSEQASKIYLTGEVGKRGFALLHSNLVQMVVERGWLGLGAFLWLSVAMVWTLTHRFKATIDGDLEAAAVGAAVAYVAFFVSGLTEYNYGTQRIVMLMWFMAGLGFAALRINRRDKV